MMLKFTFYTKASCHKKIFSRSVGGRGLSLVVSQLPATRTAVSFKSLLTVCLVMVGVNLYCILAERHEPELTVSWMDDTE